MNALIKVALFIVAANVVTNIVKRGTKKPSIIKRAVKNIINKEEVKTSIEEVEGKVNEEVKAPVVHQGAVHYFYLKDALELIASTTGNHINPFETFDDESAFATMIYGKDCSGIRVYVADDGRLFTISRTRAPHNFIKDIIVESTPLDLTDDNDREAKALLIQKDAKTADAIDDTSSIKDMK